MQDKDIKDEVLEEDINKEETHEHEHEHKHGGHTCCGKHGHKHEEETKKLKTYVDKNGFYNLFMKNPLMEYMIDDKIFKKENEIR